MLKRKVDVAIIGAGTAGMSAYRAVTRHTQSVVMIESGHYGTTCARVGCMPSKLLIAAAEAAHSSKESHHFGIIAPEVIVDGQAVMARVRSERDRFVGFALKTIDEMPAEHRLEGAARFINDHTLLIDDHTEIEADRIIIATGSRSVVPEPMSVAGDRLIVNDDVFEWRNLPESVAVFGPGVIGLELGQALARLGVRVKMFGRSGSLALLQDDEIRSYAVECFNREFYLNVDAKVDRIARLQDAVEVDYINQDGDLVSDQFDYLLAATGRRPNVDNLGLENTSVKLNDRGVPLFNRDTLQCNPGHIFLAGDANNALPLLHEANDDGKIAGDNAGRYPDTKPGLRRERLAIVFTQPQMASVGESLSQLREKYGAQLAEAKVSFESQGRSRVMLKNQGLLKVYGNRQSGLFLGAEMFGPAAEHVGHLLAWSLQAGMTVDKMLQMPVYHPVIEEGVRTALRNLRNELR